MNILEKIEEYNQIKREYIPLKIIFYLKSPIMLTYPYINFDGIIAYSTLEDIFGDLNVFSSMLPEKLIDTLKIPIEREYFEDNRKFFYKSSISRFTKNIVGSKSFYKQFPTQGLDYLKSKKSKYKMTGGPFKLYQKTLTTIFSPQCIFYCKGNYEKIKEYCKNLVGLGKKVNSGSGHISNCEIIKIDKDQSIFHNEIGLNRPIPIEYKKINLDIANMSYKPPYWSKMNHTLCYIPDGIYEE